MFFFFTCGSQDFSGPVKGYEHIQVVCPRCHNTAVTAVNRRTFFTFCFIPLVPIAWGKELRCNICQYAQSTNKDQLAQMSNNGPV